MTPIVKIFSKYILSDFAQRTAFDVRSYSLQIYCFITHYSTAHTTQSQTIFVRIMLSSHQIIFFFLSLNLLIGWQLSIWICCKPFFSLLYSCQLLCFWRLPLSIAVQVFPLPFFQILSFKDICYELVMPNCLLFP